MSLHPAAERALQEIDAAALNSDQFDGKEERGRLGLFVGRWRNLLCRMTGDLQRDKGLVAAAWLEFDRKMRAFEEAHPPREGYGWTLTGLELVQLKE